MWILSLLLFVVSTVLSIVLAPKPNSEQARPSGAGDFNFPTATAGRVIPLVWGTVLINGPNVVWWGDLQILPIKQFSGSIFSGGDTIIGWYYSVSIQMAVCLGELDFFRSVYIGNNQILGPTEQLEGTTFILLPFLYGGATPPGTGGVGGNIDFYLGSATQTQNAYLGNNANAYLWFDDYSQGEDAEPLQNFEGSPNDAYYAVYQNSAGTYAVPGSSPDDSNTNAVTADHYSSPDTASNVIKVRSSNLNQAGAPGDLNTYVGLLQHPSRPRLSDQIKMIATIQAKPSSFDSGANRIQIGCKVQDQGFGTLNAYGVFAVINFTGVNVLYTGTGGTVTLGSYTGDLTTTTATVGLQVQGNVVSLIINSVTVGSWTDAGIATIPTINNQGFSIAIDGNLNISFGTSADLSAVGIYNLGIDSLLRSPVSLVPAYRGVAYALARNFYVGTQTQIPPWAFEVGRYPNNLGLPTGMNKVNGFEANPMEVAYEIFTNKDWGLAQDPAKIDIAGFISAGTTLYVENNGFSATIDNPLQCIDLLAEVERQMDGNFFVDRNTGLWSVVLVRGGYAISDLPILDESNIKEITNFTRGAWEDTTNQVSVRFNNRDAEYQEAYAIAQDTANVFTQNGTVTNVEERYTGVKNQSLANQISWRDLRALTVPMAKVQVVMDRTFFATNPGEVFAFTDASLGISTLPVRVIRVNLGKSEDQTVTLDLVQDVFGFAAPSFANPSSTQVLPSTGQLVPITETNALVFEAPYKFNQLTPVSPGVQDRIWAGAENPNDGSNLFQIWATDVSTNPYAQVGTSQGYTTRALLFGAMGMPSTQGGDSFAVIMDQDPLSVVAASMSTAASASQIGTQLTNLVMIDQEILAFQSSALAGFELNISGVYRGLLDTVPTPHDASSKVWFLGTAGNLTDISFANFPESMEQVSTKLLNVNTSGIIPIDSTATFIVQMNSRAERPYPPAAVLMNGSTMPGDVSLDYYPLQAQFFSIHNFNLFPGTSGTAGSNTQVGVRFSVSEPGFAGSLSMLIPSTATSTSNPSTNSVILWNSSLSTQIASTNVGLTSAVLQGWSYAPDAISGFAPPILVPGTNYAVAMNLASGSHYGFTSGALSGGTTDGVFSLPANGGVSGAIGVFPSTTTTTDNFVDLFFAPFASTIVNRGAYFNFIRRDYRNTNEVLALQSEATLAPDFPSANSTQYYMTLFANGASTAFMSTSPTFTNQVFVSRRDIVYAFNGLPSTLNFVLNTEHIFLGSTFTSQQTPTVDASIHSVLTNEFFLGTTAATSGAIGTLPNSYTTSTNGTFAIGIYPPIAHGEPGAGTMQVNVNGGGWNTVIPNDGSTYYNTFSASSSQTIAVRLNGNADGNSTNVWVSIFDLQKSAEVAYGVINY